MGTFSCTDLVEVDLGEMGTAAADWKSTAASLEKLRAEVYSGLLLLSDKAQWAGENASVTKEFVRKTAKEVADLHLEAAGGQRAVGLRTPPGGGVCADRAHT